ncbi:MAG TPA: thioesterase family protein, partial [bacterium]
NDLDLNLHVNNSRYLTIMDLGRFDLAVRALGLKQVLQKRWSPVVGTLHIRFFKPLGLFQKYQLKTRVLGWDVKWFYLEQVFEFKGEVTTSAVLKILFMGPNGKVPSRLFLESVGSVRRSPQLSVDVRRWLKSDSRKKK